MYLKKNRSWIDFGRMEGVTGCDWSIYQLPNSGPTWQQLFRCKVPNLVAQIEVKVVLQVSVCSMFDFHNQVWV